MPAETSMAICSVMFSGMLEKLPDLRLCFAHGGGSFPGTVGRVQHGFDVRPDLCATDTSLPPREWGGKFWSDSLVHDRDMLDLIVKVFGEWRPPCGAPGWLLTSMHRRGQSVPWNGLSVPTG